MTSSTYQASFHHIIKMDRFSISMDKLMKRVSQHGVNNLARKLIPTIVHLRVMREPLAEDLTVLRQFLRNLRETQSKYFVRFATSLLWTMESDNSDVFYTRENSSNLYKDVVFDIRVVGGNHVEIKVGIPFETRQQSILRELSRVMTPLIDGPQGTEEDDIFLMMVKYHRDNHIVSMINHLDEDLHILFVPNEKQDRFFPIPLFGMSANDALRRFTVIDRSLDFLEAQYHEVMGEKLMSSDIMMVLVNSIQESEQTGDRATASKTTYAFAELLFGYYLSRRSGMTTGISAHELLSFGCIEEGETGVLEIYNMRLKDLSA